MALELKTEKNPGGRIETALQIKAGFGNVSALEEKKESTGGGGVRAGGGEEIVVDAKSTGWKKRENLSEKGRNWQKRGEGRHRGEKKKGLRETFTA